MEVQSKAQYLLHKPHRRQRWAIVNALNNGNDEHRRRARRLGFCGATPSLRSRGGEVFACMQRCRDRLCPLCATHRGREAARKAIALTRSMNAPRFITLTTRSVDAPLFLRLRHLVCSFNALRKTAEWKAWVKGGIYALEVTFNPSSGHWHPHLHIIADGEFIPQAKLRALWQRITRDSFVVDVRAVPDREKAAKYIATYVAKPFDVSSWPPEAIREYAETLHGARMINAFGSCHGIPSIDADNTPEVEGPSSHLIHGSTLVRWAAKSKAAAHVREILARMSPLHAIAVELEPRPSPAPVADWELRYVRIVTRALDALVPGDLPAHFDAYFVPERVAAIPLAAELAPGEIADDGGHGRPDPHADAVDLLTLFDHDQHSRPDPSS